MGLNHKQMRDGERGSAMVELVFILPILCTLIFAIAEFGIAFGQWQALNNAAREGARTAIVYRAACASGAEIAAAQTEVTDQVTEYAALSGLTVGDLTITVINVCGAAGTDADVTVTADYDFAVLPGFSSGVPTSITLTGHSIMRNEG